MMKIYDFEGFPNPARVRIALAEKGIADKVEFVSIDVPSGQHRSDEFLAKNPDGAVPVLELDDGTTISECTAITEYIDHEFGPPSLTGTGAKDRAVIHMMQRRAEQRVLDAVAGYFHNATPGLGPELETNQNNAWGEAQRLRALDGMKYFDSVLADHKYVCGESFSMADITLYAGLAFADFAQIEVPPQCTHLTQWRNKCASRPSMSD